jgi:hypothetical protein
MPGALTVARTQPFQAGLYDELKIKIPAPRHKKLFHTKDAGISRISPFPQQKDPEAASLREFGP